MAQTSYLGNLKNFYTLHEAEIGEVVKKLLWDFHFPRPRAFLKHREAEIP